MTREASKGCATVQIKSESKVLRPRPALRYHGGKWVLAPWLISHFPPHRAYTEVYGGAASVLLRKPRSYAEIYNDLDGEIVNVFRVLRDAKMADELRHLLVLTPYAREEFTDSYEPCSNPIERARRTIVKSFMGFGSDGITAAWNTGFRNNSTREGTTPAHDWMNYPPNVPLLTERLSGVIIERRDAADVLRQHDSPSTLHYVDPPYVHATRPGTVRRKHAYRYEMSDDDHRSLAAVLHSLSGMVVLSGYPCDLYDRELYAGWERIERKALADGAQKRTEVVWMNPAASANKAQQGLSL